MICPIALPNAAIALCLGYNRRNFYVHKMNVFCPELLLISMSYVTDTAFFWERALSVFYQSAVILLEIREQWHLLALILMAEKLQQSRTLCYLCIK